MLRKNFTIVIVWQQLRKCIIFLVYAFALTIVMDLFLFFTWLLWKYFHG